MWLTGLALILAEEAPTPVVPPAVPYETIGIILVAMVTGLTGVIVALIQRGKPKTEAESSPVPVTVLGQAFIISKEDWEKVRDTVIRLETLFNEFREAYDYHEKWTSGEVRKLDSDLAHVKGQLGIKQ